MQPNPLQTPTETPAEPVFGLQGLQLVIVDMMAADPLRAWSGQELVESSAGRLKMGSIYVTLQRMQAKGLLLSRRELPEEDCAVIRRLYTLTPKALALKTPEVLA
jgi:DNA-binding PadR family transcriptional regulator